MVTGFEGCYYGKMRVNYGKMRVNYGKMRVAITGK